jgi:hypothetical protein
VEVFILHCLHLGQVKINLVSSFSWAGAGMTGWWAVSRVVESVSQLHGKKFYFRSSVELLALHSNGKFRSL